MHVLLKSSSNKATVRQPCGGSHTGKAFNIYRDHRALGNILSWKYFATCPIYDHSIFRLRFPVSRNTYDCLFTTTLELDAYFVQKDCTDLKGVSQYQKFCAVMRMFVTRVCVDTVDDKFVQSQITALICVQRFCGVAIKTLEAKFLRTSTKAETARFSLFSEKRGFQG